MGKRPRPEKKKAAARPGLPLPEDIELMELAHMACRADKKPIDTFVKEYAASL